MPEGCKAPMKPATNAQTLVAVHNQFIRRRAVCRCENKPGTAGIQGILHFTTFSKD